MKEPLHVLTIVGARPQIIKASAITRAVNTSFNGRIRQTLLHTGQHYDRELSDVFFEELGMAPPDVQLTVGSGGHGEQTARMLEGVERAILEHRPDIVLLYGDTNSTLAGAVAAGKLRIPLAHVEAGLRSFNKAMPEEINRVVSDHCSTWLFCPTGTAVRNLGREGFPVDHGGRATIDRPRVLNVGDVMLDNCLHYASVAKERSSILPDLGLEHNGYFLVTIHRDGNTDDPARLDAIVDGLIQVHQAHGFPLVLPLHPRTRKRLELRESGSALLRSKEHPGIMVIPPAGFLDMIELERNARLIITDSGGVQKEAHFFDRPSAILRSETEWVELVEYGRSILVDADRDRMMSAVESVLSSELPAMPPLFGEGNAAFQICEALLK